ncbi:hypothetical protein DUI87_25910 [Hirundo rustica rustica]|uniref:Uncharacterized protein n=1 Tax=Hirundo rustica rustica TaxID=333673 RepID=A0A3M0JRS3_HIRRU|nr:hypothetical protein DUI87_25910 [Hirundo rustica rustica]
MNSVIGQVKQESEDWIKEVATYRSTEPRADSPLAPSAPAEEAKEEQNEHQPPAVLTPQPELSETVPLEKEHEQLAFSEMPCQPCQIEGELFPAEEEEKQLRQQVEEPQENGQNIEAEAQAELPKAASGIMAVKRRDKEDMRRTQDHWDLQQQRGYQQNQNFGEKLQAELQETQARIKAREKRLAEELKILRGTQVKIHLLLEEQATLRKQVGVLTSRLAARKGFQQAIGNEEPQDSCKAQQVSQAEALPVEQVVKMVEKKRTRCKEVEHLNKEMQVCLEGGKESLGESGMVILAVTLQKIHVNGFWRKCKKNLAMNSSKTSLWFGPIQFEMWTSEKTHGRALHVADSIFLRACI